MSEDAVACWPKVKSDWRINEDDEVPRFVCGNKNENRAKRRNNTTALIIFFFHETFICVEIPSMLQINKLWKNYWYLKVLIA